MLMFSGPQKLDAFGSAVVRAQTTLSRSSRGLVQALAPRLLPQPWHAALGEFADRVRHLRSQWAVDHHGREYFVQSDDRLLRQQSRWVERYS